MWATSATNFGPVPCRCTTTACTCNGSRRGQYTIYYRSYASAAYQEPIELEDKPKKNDPVPPWLAGAPFGGKMRKRQRGPEFSSPRALRQHRSQSR